MSIIICRNCGKEIHEFSVKVYDGGKGRTISAWIGVGEPWSCCSGEYHEPRTAIDEFNLLIDEYYQEDQSPV